MSKTISYLKCFGIRSGMAMGTKKSRERQEEFWYRSELAEAPGHPFYRKLEGMLRQAGFDEFCERECKCYYADGVGRPSLAPGVYFRLMLIGFFEGLDSERGIAWRVADFLSLREFLGYGIDESTPDHVTVSRTRRLLDTERIRRYSAGHWSSWREPGWSKARRWGWIRRRWRPMPP